MELLLCFGEHTSLRKLSTVKPLRAKSGQNFIVNCQLSTVNCQLSTVNCPLSIGYSPLSIAFELLLHFGEGNPLHHRPAVRAVAGKVGLVHLAEERYDLLPG